LPRLAVQRRAYGSPHVSVDERLYLDHAATSPLHPAAAAELAAGASGRLADASGAKARLAAALGVVPERLVLTEGGSQANAAALRSLAERGRAAGRLHVISQPSEHPSVLETLAELESAGCELEWLSLDAEGRVDPAQLERRLRPETSFVSVMSANHETGTLQPTRALAERCAAAGVPLHSDAVQALRYFRPDQLAGDLLTLGGHKLRGPRGIGALIVGPSAGAYDLELSSGAPSPSRVAALAAALEAEPPSPAPALAASRDALQAELVAAIPGLEVNGGHGPGARLPGHLSLSVPGLSGEALVLDLDLAGIAASSGAACSSGTEGPSPVLIAMGRDRSQASGSLRLTLGSPLDATERARVAGALVESVRRLRSLFA
jgi:cysteine desulfurase